MSRPRYRWFTLLTVVILLTSTAGTGVAAAQSLNGAAGTIVVEEGETVERIDGIAGTIVVRGTVTGDISGTAGSVQIADTGQVGGNLEASGGTILVAGTVDGDVRVGAGSFELVDSGLIRGTLDVGAGSVRVDGEVGGDVRAAGDSVALGPNAAVGGEFRYDADEFTQDLDATVDGGVVQDSELSGNFDSGFGFPTLPWWFGSAYGVVVNLLLGAVLLLIFPRFSTSIATRVVDKPATAGGIGLLTLIATPIALLLLAVTVIGLPISLAGIGLFILGVWIATIYGEYAIGRWAIGLLNRENRWLALLVGLIGFTIIGFIPIVGSLAGFVALLLGLGALVLGLREQYRTDRSGRDGGAVA